MIGETKLGYQITEFIGQGGFGTVYKAVKKTKAMESVRALKHISLPSRKQYTDIYNSMGNDIARTDAYFDQVLQEILNEIRILADLTNKGVKNVVWYYENEIEDTPSPKHYDIYLLMEFLTSLPSYIETHEIKVKDVIKIGTDILSALIECHKSKIIHRDIKTDNIFVSDDGDFKLGDFGVSKKLSDSSRATSMKGTPNYIAPEIYLGQEYNETVDLYSLGIVLYRLLNYNRNPFMPDYPSSYNSEDEDRAFEFRMRGDVPKKPVFAQGELGDVILKSIASKENRYQSAVEFKEALEKVSNSMSNEEKEKVALENVMKNIDFSTFGSRNDLTQMARDNQNSVSNMSNNSMSYSNNNNYNNNNSYNNNGYNNNNYSQSFSMNNSSNNMYNQNNKKSSPLVPILVVIVLLLGGAGAYFFMNNRVNSGKFVQVDGQTKFLKRGGEYARNEWVYFNDEEYYFNGRQTLVTNTTVEDNGKTYYVNADGAKIVEDWYKSSDGKEYFLDSNGEPYKKTAKNINGKDYYFNDKGEKIVDGWYFNDNAYYYIDENGNMIKGDFKADAGVWYYLGNDGKMLRDTFYDVNGLTYYFDGYGKMKANELFNANSSIYYAGATGAISKNGWCFNNQYYAGADGKILTNTTTPDGIKVDAAGRKVIVNTVSPVTGSTGGGNNKMSSGTSTGGASRVTTGSAIKNGAVDWGQHLKYTETVYLDEYGLEGNAKISIDITKLREDGSQEVSNVNNTLQEVYQSARERAEFELPFKYFELEKTSLSTCNETTVVIIVTGEIKYEDNTKENMRYKIMLDRTQGTVSYEKVR